MVNKYLAISLGAGIGVLGGCWQRLDNHCGNLDGDMTCLGRGDAVYCDLCRTENDGCAVERPSQDCYFAGADEDGESSSTVGGSETIEPTGSTAPTEGTDPSSTQSETMTEETETASTTSSGCSDSSECTDALAPICFDMQCVPCGDAGMPDDACAEKNAGLPVCGDEGACVECTPTNPSACGDTTPVCDGPSSSCVGCTFHEQCEATACDMITGACFDDCVVEVDDDVGGDIDYDNVGDAMADGCVVIVHALDGGASYQEALSADGISVALLAAEGELPVVQGIGGNPSLSASDGASVFVQGVRFNGSTGAAGVDVDGATLWLDRTAVVGNDGGGILLAGGASGHVRNCFVGGADATPAVDVQGSSFDAVYSTLGGVAFTSPALACSSAMSVDLRNSIVVAQDPSIDEIQCTGAVVTYSATEAAVAGAGNTSMGDMNTNWFSGYASGNFALTGNIPDDVLTTASWQTGDPRVDIGGDPRPDVEGTADVAGADVP